MSYLQRAFESDSLMKLKKAKPTDFSLALKNNLTVQKKRNNMSKIQIVGLVLLVTGIIMYLTLENNTAGFFSSLLMGGGVGVLIAGYSKKSAK